VRRENDASTDAENSKLRNGLSNKVKLFLCLINEAKWGSGGIAPPFLALHGGVLSASRPGRFTSGKEPRYPSDRTLGGPQSLFGH
jgi:hypothetical protein